jgi:hypothetical protein
MNLKSSLVAAALAALVSIAHAQGATLSPAAQAGAGGLNDPAFVTAMELYRAGRWSAAYGRFIHAADSGNVEAARIALLMLRHGRELFGTEWSAAPSQVELWERSVRAAQPLRLAVFGE